MTKSGLRIVGIGLLGAVALALGVRLLAGGRTPSPSAGVTRAQGGGGDAPPSPSWGDFEALRKALEAEVTAREALGREMERLREEIALERLQLGVEGAPAGPRNSAAPPSVEPGGEATGRQTRSFEVPAPAAEGAGSDERPAFDEQALLAAGMRPADVKRLRERWHEFEMEKLYQNDLALQEGRFLKPRHRQELHRLEKEYREEVGEEFYDAYLFATGKPNRVVVREVLSGSQASRAGFQTGDVILSYDGVRIFRPGELSRAATAGVAGGSARVEILRDRQPTSLYVSRGLLGVLLDSDRRAPQGD